jgi:purine nucleosidase
MSPDAFNPPSRPALILLDTDMATDCDDAGAMAVLHALAGSGEAEIRAIVVNNKDATSANTVAAINAFYGRPDIPLGICQGDAVGIAAGPFAQTLAADSRLYGHVVRSRAEIPSATSIYRRTLAALDDGLGVIVSIGHLNNLHDLLHSGPDEHSPLPGLELVRQKVAHVVMMGGDYPSGREHNFFARGSDAVTAAVLKTWPTPILFSGYTLGLAVKTGPKLATLPDNHPVRRAYALHGSDPLKNGRPSWDQTAVLAAVRGPAPFWKLGPAGWNRATADGSNHWETDAHAPHAYLVENVPPASAAAEIESLMLAVR